MKVTAIAAAVLGAGLFVAASFTPTQAQVIATVDGKSITEADLSARRARDRPNPSLAPEERRRVLVEAGNPPPGARRRGRAGRVSARRQGV